MQYFPISRNIFATLPDEVPEGEPPGVATTNPGNFSSQQQTQGGEPWFTGYPPSTPVKPKGKAKARSKGRSHQEGRGKVLRFASC